MGQESNLQPAVLEFASFRLPLSAHVHQNQSLTDFPVRSVVLCPHVSLWVVVSIVVSIVVNPEVLIFAQTIYTRWDATPWEWSAMYWMPPCLMW